MARKYASGEDSSRLLGCRAACEFRRAFGDIVGAALQKGVGLGRADPFRDAVLIERHAQKKDEKYEDDRAANEAKGRFSHTRST